MQTMIRNTLLLRLTLNEQWAPCDLSFVIKILQAPVKTSDFSLATLIAAAPIPLPNADPEPEVRVFTLFPPARC